MTLEEFKSLVKNRPEPDTPGFYWLGTMYVWGDGKYSPDEHNTPTKQCRKQEPYTLWRYESSFKIEYYATFEDAFKAMHTIKERILVPNPIITGYVIQRAAFGPENGSYCVNYRIYDAQFCEIGHSVHSLHHEATPGIYGKYLGRFPEEIRFHPGDIVEAHAIDGRDKRTYHTLGIVVESPMTVEQMYRPYFNIDDNYPDEFGTDRYTICFAPLGSHSSLACRSMPVNKVYPPAFEVPEEARKCLVQYLDTLKAKVDENRSNLRIDVELVVVGEPVALAPIQVQLTDSVKNYDWRESGKNATGATIYRCIFSESATAVNEHIQKLKEKLPNHEVHFRATHEVSYLFEVFTDDRTGEYFPEHSCYSYYMYIINLI
jgi:hypothetical protein